MSSRSFDVVLVKRTNGSWGSDALSLPGAHLLSVSEPGGQVLSYTVTPDASVAINSAAPTFMGRVELPEELVAQSSLDQAKIALDQEKLAIEERAGRRTLWTSVVTAVLSAAAAVIVAIIAHLGESSPAVPKAYRDLVDCRESITRLGALAQLPQQTLPDLREVVSHSVDSCRDRLNTAITASQP